MRLKQSERELRIFTKAISKCLTGRGSALEGSVELEFRTGEEESFWGASVAVMWSLGSSARFSIVHLVLAT